MAKKAPRKSATRSKSPKKKKSQKKTPKSSPKGTKAASKAKPISKSKRTSPAKGPAKKASKSGTPKKSLSRSTAKANETKSKSKSRSRGRDEKLGIKNQHMDFLTYKPDQVRKFYEEMLELKAEVRDTEGLGYLVVKTSPTSSLGFMPPHPEMRGDQPLPREPTIYLRVGDVDHAYKLLSAKGVGFIGPPEEMPWGDRVASTTDPEGRTVMIASSSNKK